MKGFSVLSSTLLLPRQVFPVSSACHSGSRSHHLSLLCRPSWRRHGLCGPIYQGIGGEVPSFSRFLAGKNRGNGCKSCFSPIPNPETGARRVGKPFPNSARPVQPRFFAISESGNDSITSFSPFPNFFPEQFTSCFAFSEFRPASNTGCAAMSANFS